MTPTPAQVTHGKHVTRIGRIPNALAAAHVLATSPLFSEKAVFVFVPTLVDQHIIAAALPELLLLAPGVLNTQKPKKHTKTSVQPQVRVWRNDRFDVAALNDRGWTIVDQSAANDVLPSPHVYRSTQLQLHTEDTISFSELKKELVARGYERDSAANMPGRFAVRGNIVDIHLNQPFRLEFDDETITSIQEFNLATVTAGQAVDSCTIPDLTGTGHSSVMEHLPEHAVVVVLHGEPLAIQHEQFLLEPFSSSNVVETGPTYSETKSYHLRYEELLKDARNFSQVVVFTADPKKVKAVFSGMPHTHIVRSTVLSNGCAFGTQLLALTDRSIGIGEDRKKRQASRAQRALLQGLSPGDYVVHAYHGIARFAGMNTMEVNDMLREYFVLEYAGRDKVYVPVELAERVDVYVGDPNPRLHRLSDASWTEVVARVKEHTLELARELLNLYARRSVSEAPQCLEQQEEKELDAQCPFTLTPDQETALRDVLADVEQTKPMDRLLCGDVGFGKTEVALRAAFRVVLNGFQVAILAPTTVLAQQHFDTLSARLQPFGVNVQLLSRFQTSTQQSRVVQGLANGTVDVVIGTHRLFSRDVHFKRLGFIVIDEEQRFGVKAKEALVSLRKNAHVLTMTATPIPRTLHLSLSGIRDISTIMTPPDARKAVQTVIEPLSDELIQHAITREMRRGGETYYIYNRVQSIEQRKIQLQALVPKARIGVAHGQMPAKELAHVMHAFDTKEIDVLLATTIVENGLDIPTANTLIVENASQFGLAELYQLRGRVGRSHEQGYAYCLYNERTVEDDVRKRFVALQESSHLGAGFELAMKDMEIRGVGNILGKEQHGHAVKIGLHLYTRLLNHAMQEVEGIAEEPVRDIPIDLPIEARIPSEIIPEELERILLYQQLANIQTVEELEEQRERFAEGGRLPEPYAGLFDVLRIKLLAGRSSLLSIDTTYPAELNGLESPRITITAEQPLPILPASWDVVPGKAAGGRKARTTVAALGTKWIEHLADVITDLKREEKQ